VGATGRDAERRKSVSSENFLNEKVLLSFPIHHFVPLEYFGRQVHVMKDSKLFGSLTIYEMRI
jgi:hypothetical protein